MSHIRIIKLAVVTSFFFSVILASVYINLPKSHAQVTYQSRIFDGLSNDGYTQRYGLVYQTCHDGAMGDSKDDTGNLMLVGQSLWPASDYFVYRSYVYFDTSTLADNANLTTMNVTLSLYMVTKYDNNYNITVQNGQPTYPHDTLHQGDYWYGYYSGNGGTANVSAGGAGAYQNITFTNDGVSWVHLDGITKLCLKTSRDIDSTPPTSDEYVEFATYEQGSNYWPLLYVEYEYAGTTYVLHGAFYEDGTPFSGNTSVTVYTESEPPQQFYLPNGTTDNTYTVEVEGIAICFVWNISNAGMNHTRVRWIMNYFEEFYVFIPNADEPAYLYSFEITDMLGITNGYLESTINCNGTTRVVERQKADTVNPLTFYMTFAHRYGLRLLCDEGTYSYGDFLAQSVQTQNLIITPLLFSTSYEILNVSITATRQNSTWIQVLYQDNVSLTEWVNVSFSYMSNQNWTLEYSVNNTGQSQTINWYNANETRSYLVTVTASRTSGILTYAVSLPIEASTTTIWASLDTLFPDAPIPASQIIGFLITMFTFASFSYAHRAVGCGVGVTVAAFLMFIGMLQISSTLIVVSFVIVIFYFIKEGKKVEREI